MAISAEERRPRDRARDAQRRADPAVREAERARKARYYVAHRDEIAARKAKRRADPAVREAERARNAKYYAAHRDEIVARKAKREFDAKRLCIARFPYQNREVAISALQLAGGL